MSKGMLIDIGDFSLSLLSAIDVDTAVFRHSYGQSLHVTPSIDMLQITPQQCHRILCRIFGILSVAKEVEAYFQHSLA